jgi:hypothetical protein
MAKYIVGFEEYAFYTVPVEAASADEARDAARAIMDREDVPADYVDFRLADDLDPNPEEVDDATFERCLPAVAA